MSEPLRIVLVGLMGAGKSAVAGRLAECLDAEVIDTDAAVERSTGLTVAELFEREGEASFRRLELAALEMALGAEGRTIIATGGALPCAGLQVGMKEDVELDGSQVKVLRRDHYLHIRFQGDDARKGQVLLEPGVILNPGALALMASLGHTQIPVTRLPRVFHAATGNEIVPPEMAPEPGQIRDSNSILVRAFLNQWRIEPTQVRLPEDEAAACAQLENDTVAQADVLLISGGASVGEHDFTRRLLDQLGYAIHICKTNTRPGKPLIFGTRGQSVAFGLPGNPLAHFVCLNLYVRAALDQLCGLPNRFATQIATISTDLEDLADSRETLWPSQVDFVSDVLTPLRWSSSGDLTCLATANALARIPVGCERLAKGAPIEFFPIRFFS